MYAFASNWQAGDKVSGQLIVAMNLVPGIGIRRTRRHHQTPAYLKAVRLCILADSVDGTCSAHALALPVLPRSTVNANRQQTYKSRVTRSVDRGISGSRPSWQVSEYGARSGWLCDSGNFFGGCTPPRILAQSSGVAEPQTGHWSALLDADDTNIGRQKKTKALRGRAAAASVSR